MERQKCKLCSRDFANGKALGGHMKAHMATLPLPPKPQLTDSASDDDDGPIISGNQRKRLGFGDPDVVEDRESETESRNPTRPQSYPNRTRKANRKPAGPNSPASSVSDGSPEENVAVCLMMLSRDRWPRKNKKPRIFEDGEYEESESKSSKSPESEKIPGKYRCGKCKKMFRSQQALGSHRVTHKKFSGAGAGDSRIYECPYCLKIFGSGQALGGHKRSHLMGSYTNSSISQKKLFAGESSIDLNLPAPVEEDSYSVVSDAEFIR